MSTGPRWPYLAAELPDDLEQAIESLRLVITRHRYAGWTEAIANATADRLYTLAGEAVSAPPRLGGSNSAAEGAK